MLNVDSLVQTVHTFSKEIGLEFGIKKCWMLVRKHGKIANTEGILLPEEKVTKEIDNSRYMYLGILETVEREGDKRLVLKGI